MEHENKSNAPEVDPSKATPQPAIATAQVPQDKTQTRESFNEVRQKFKAALKSRSNFPEVDLHNTVIGQGEHSVAYLGEECRSKRLLVVKYDKRDPESDLDYPALKEKIENLRSLNHPYIAKYIGYLPYIGQEAGSGKTFFLMEYIPGESLRDVLKRRGRVEARDALKWTRQILDALAYLHAQGDIHGNIRTDNIMLTHIQSGGVQTEEIRLIDFKLSAPFHVRKGNGKKKRSGQLLSSRDIFGKPVNSQDFHQQELEDIYYTGAVLFYMLTGMFPSSMLSTEGKRRILIGNGAPDDICNVIGKATESNPQKRYQTATEMNDALSALKIETELEQVQAELSAALKQCREEARKSKEEIQRAEDTERRILKETINIHEVIGYGEHSTVYLGTWTGSGKYIAVKRDVRNWQKEYVSLDPEIKNLKKLTKLNIPNIASFYNFISNKRNGQAFFIMEYIPGPSLQDILEGHGSAANGGIVTQGAVLNWGCKILEMLNSIHESGLAYGKLDTDSLTLRIPNRNSETANGGLQEASESVTVKRARDVSKLTRDISEYDICLIGFRLKDPENDAQRMTPSFRSGGENPLDDIYDLGALMFRMLTGEVCPQASNRNQKQEILVNKGVTAEVCDVICTALEASPKNRYQSAEDMLRAIRSLPGNDPRKRNIAWRGVRAALLSLVVLTTGVCLYCQGGRFINRAQEMNLEAQLALKALNQADYSGAISLALQATENEGLFLPPITASAQDALARVTAAYNFAAGYKPLHSEPVLRGDMVRLRLSADGSFIVALVKNGSSNVGGYLIQIFDTVTGAELDTRQANGALPDFVIRQDNTLIYAGLDALIGYNMKERNEIWHGPSIPGADALQGVSTLPPISLALSSDGVKVAALYLDEQTVFLCDTLTNDMRVIRLQRGNFPPNLTRQRIANYLLALDNGGTHLAVSFSDGSLCLYRMNPHDAGTVESPAMVSESLTLRERYPEYFPYNHYEGGFYDGVALNESDGKKETPPCFFYAAYVSQPSDERTEVLKPEERISECRMYDVKRLDDVLDSRAAGASSADETEERPDNLYNINKVAETGVPIRTAVDSDGIYMAFNAEIYHILPYLGANGTFGNPKRTEQGDVLFIRHAPGRLLAVTVDKVLLYEENGEYIEDAVKTEIIDNAPFLDACISEEYILLAGKNRISVLRWENCAGTNVISYPADHPHDAARVRIDADGSPASVLLYNDSGFRIFAPDGTLIGKADFQDWSDILELRYLRKPETDADPRKECLKVVYTNRVDYYSAEDGTKIEPSASDGKSVRSFNRADYESTYSVGMFRVKCRGGNVTAYAGRTFIASYSAKLICASEANGKLLLSLREGDASHSVLLDRSGNEIADFLNSECEFLSNGKLYKDNLNGRILLETIPNLSEMRNFAKERGSHTG